MDQTGDEFRLGILVRRFEVGCTAHNRRAPPPSTIDIRLPPFGYLEHPRHYSAGEQHQLTVNYEVASRW